MGPHVFLHSAPAISPIRGGGVYTGGRRPATCANNTAHFDYPGWLGRDARAAVREAGMRAAVTGCEQEFPRDAFGHRVEKTAGGASSFYLHDLAGRPITELSSTGGFTHGEIYAPVGGNARHLATYANSTTYFDYPDWLGTTRMIATLGGLEADQCTSWPYGAGLNCTASPTPVQFTGQVHDAATGLDRFPAPCYTSTWGRWMTPDPLGGHLGNPVTLDKYVYVADNPLTFTDPTGQYLCADSKNCSSKDDKALAQALANDLKSKSSDVVRAAEAYGAAGQDNGVTVRFGNPGKGEAGTTASSVAFDPFRRTLFVRIRRSRFRARSAARCWTRRSLMKGAMPPMRSRRSPR